MKQYRVIPLSCGGINNKIYEAGQIVPESGFYPEAIPVLVEQGFLELYSDEPATEFVSPDPVVDEKPPAGPPKEVAPPTKSVKNGPAGKDKK